MLKDKSTLWHRMRAAVTGEVSADTLEAYRRVGLAVYDALEHCQEHRKHAAGTGKNAWTLHNATKSEILCSWNALVPQTLGDGILDTDYKLDVYVPADLPSWSEVESCPNAQHQLPTIPFAPPQAGSTPRLPQPDEAGFDAWCLTNAEARERFKSDCDAAKAIKTLWSLDPNPRQTLEIQSEINAALARGDIAFATDNYSKKLGHFFCAPFEREIMIGSFKPTTKFEYGDPNEAPDH